SWLFQLSRFLQIHQRIVWGHLLDELSCLVLSLPLFLIPNIGTTPIANTSPTIPPSPDYTPASPDYLPASDTNSDIPDTPPSPTHGTPFTKTTLSTQRSPTASGALRCRVMILTLGQPIPHGRSYRYHLNGPVHMITARKRVRPMPTHRLAIRHSVNYSSSDDSSSSSSSKTSSDSSRSRSPIASVPLSSPIPGALPSVRSDLLPLPNRIRSPESATDLEDYSEDSFKPYVPREVGLRVDFEDKGSEQSRDRGIDARVVVEAIDREEIEMGMRGPVKVRVDRVTHPVVADDIPEPTQEGAIEVTYETLGDLVHRFHDHTKEIPVHQRIGELERDNRRLKDIVDVKCQRVTRFRRKELRVQRELRQICRFRFYDHMRIASLESCVRRHLGYHS
ncbi:hypothetical protein Tco_1161431, partial [Tanacetum coccineum]